MDKSFKIFMETAEYLEEYASLPSSFTTSSVYDVIQGSPQKPEIKLHERQLAIPLMKDYDREDQDGPLTWSIHFDLQNWGFLLARRAGKLLGCAALAFDTPGLDMLEDRRDQAVLWDIRVLETNRRCGVGRKLFEAAEDWATRRGCSTLKIETQNINVTAGKFYRDQGCEIHSSNPSAYPDFPNETQIIWHKKLEPSGSV